MTTLTMNRFCYDCAKGDYRADLSIDTKARVECSSCGENIDGIKYRADEPGETGGVSQREVTAQKTKRTSTVDAVSDNLEPKGQQLALVPAAQRRDLPVSTRADATDETTYMCAGTCPGFAGLRHHQLDCPDHRVSNVARATHDAGSTLGAAYKPAQRLQRMASAQRLLAETMDLLVADARAAGLSWADIGDQLGVSKQAAAQKYGKKA